MNLTHSCIHTVINTVTTRSSHQLSYLSRAFEKVAVQVLAVAMCTLRYAATAKLVAGKTMAKCAEPALALEL